MRDFRIQALIDLVRVVYKKEMRMSSLLLYLIHWVTPRSFRPKANKFYDVRDFSYLRKILLKLGQNDPLWFPRLIEPTTKGIRGWEYGLMFDKIKFRRKKVLDLGAGNSRLPRYLSQIGSKVTMVDINHPLEVTEVKKSKNLKFVIGDMTNLSFKSNSFDVVVCISAIEHVDMKGGGYYGSHEYNSRALSSIKEMIRVLKSGGDFYLTTDFYDKRQKVDGWVFSGKVIRGAFELNVLKEMVKVIKESGVLLDSEPDVDPGVLLSDKLRSNYRGRYFSTFAFRGKKI